MENKRKNIGKRKIEKQAKERIASKPMAESAMGRTGSEAVLNLVKEICKKRKIRGPVMQYGNDQIADMKLWVGILAEEAPGKGVSNADQGKIYDLIQKEIVHYEKNISDSGELFEEVAWLCHNFVNLVRGYSPENIGAAMGVIEKYKDSRGKIKNIVGVFESIPYHWHEFITPENEGKVVNSISNLVHKVMAGEVFDNTGRDWDPFTDFCLYSNAVYNSITREDLKGKIKPDPVAVVDMFIKYGGSQGAYRVFYKMAGMKYD